MTDASDYMVPNSAPALDMGLPANVAAEKMILGAILLANQALSEAEERLTPEDFSLDSHQRIYQRMTELGGTGHAIDLVTLANELARFKEIESVGGVSYLLSLTEGLPRRPVIEEYIRIVKDKSLLRQLMLICSAGIARSADQSEPAINIGLALTAQVQDAVTVGLASTLERAGDYLNRSFPSARDMTVKTAKMQGVMTGFEEFDEMTCGLQKGELIIIAARPGMGKTSWASKVAEHISIDGGLTGAFFSLEMSKDSLLRRMICSRARVPFQVHKNGTMTEMMLDEYESVYEEFCNSNLFIDDTPKTAPRIAAQCRAMKAKEGLDYAVVDYLGYLQHEETKRNRSLAQEVGLDALTFKFLAKELGIPVVVLSQLSRESTKRTDKRPALQDLRDSGNLEEHADMVAFVHREGYYDPKDEGLRNKAEIIIAKQRSGPVGTCNIHWDGLITRFSDVIDPKKFKKLEGEWWNRA